VDVDHARRPRSHGSFDDAARSRTERARRHELHNRRYLEHRKRTDPRRARLPRAGRQHVGYRDRTLAAFRTPLFDNPGTLGFYDPKQKLTISSDFLGAALPTSDDALADDIASVVDDDVTAGQLLWGSADSPWVHSTDETKFASSLSTFAARGEMSTVLSTHLPPIRGNVDRHLKTLAMLPGAAPFVGPDQAALEAMLAEMGAEPH